MIKVARGRRVLAALMSGGLLAGVVAMTATGPANAVAKPAVGLSAFVNGVEVHAHAVSAPDPKLANVSEAYSISAVNSSGLTQTLSNEVNDGITPQAGKNAYARGGGVDLGLGSTSPTDVNTEPIQLSTAEASAPTASPPFTDGLITSQTVDLAGGLDPLANASALGGRAAALYNPNYLFPALGNPLTYAFGTAADAQVINTGEGLDPLGRFTDAVLLTNPAPTDDPDRNVASSQSFTYLVNNGDGTCGIASETHITIAPVNISAIGLTIEVAGDWVMKAQVTGKATGNYLKYGPDLDGTHVLNVTDNATGESLGALNLQDIFTDTGLAEQLDGLDPLVDVAVGADARAITPKTADGTAGVPNDTSSPTVTSTRVAGAADVVRVKALSAAAPLDAADLRVGHFETDLQVPTGGVNCEIPVGKTANVPVANTGSDLVFTVKVPIDTNAVKPFPCELTNVVVTDVLKLEKADDPSRPPKMNLTGGTGPHGEKATVAADKQSLTFPSIGTWKPGDPPLTLTITATVPANSGTGIIRDEATATATAANCSGKNSVLGSVIGLITGDATGVGNGSVNGSGNFFGSNFTGLTGNVNGGGPISVKGTGALSGPPIALAKVLAVTGRNDALYLGLAVGALVSTLALVRLRRRVTAG